MYFEWILVNCFPLYEFVRENNGICPKSTQNTSSFTVEMWIFSEKNITTILFVQYLLSPSLKYQPLTRSMQGEPVENIFCDRKQIQINLSWSYKNIAK